MTKKIKKIEDCTTKGQMIDFLIKQGKPSEPNGKYVKFFGKKGTAKLENSSQAMGKPERDWVLTLLKAAGVIVIVVALLGLFLKPYLGG